MKNVFRAFSIFAACAFSLLAQQSPSAADGRISDQVRMRLVNDPDVKGGADEVTVRDGVVTIRGKVGTERGRKKAEKLAKKVKGVKSVENNLVVGPPTE